MWIDDDQLDLLLMRLGLHADEPLGPIAAKPASALACPVCAGAMVQEASYGDDGSVVVDVCPDHGAWFDRDELGVVLYDLQEEHVSRGADHDAGTSLNTALRALSTTVRFAARREDRKRGRPTTRPPV
jgi:Zn-finger nucleic acid-binding protein